SRRSAWRGCWSSPTPPVRGISSTSATASFRRLRSRMRRRSSSRYTGTRPAADQHPDVARTRPPAQRTGDATSRNRCAFCRGCGARDGGTGTGAGLDGGLGAGAGLDGGGGGGTSAQVERSSQGSPQDRAGQGTSPQVQAASQGSPQSTQQANAQPTNGAQPTT